MNTKREFTSSYVVEHLGSECEELRKLFKYEFLQSVFKKARLTQEEHLIIWLKVCKGLSFNAIKKEFNLSSQSTVRRRYYSAMEKLKRIIMPECVGKCPFL